MFLSGAAVWFYQSHRYVLLIASNVCTQSFFPQTWTTPNSTFLIMEQPISLLLPTFYRRNLHSAFKFRKVDSGWRYALYNVFQPLWWWLGVLPGCGQKKRQQCNAIYMINILLVRWAAGYLQRSPWPLHHFLVSKWIHESNPLALKGHPWKYVQLKAVN